MTASTEQYSPFQQELLNHLAQLSTNVNTLVQVFINLQSQLTLNHSPNTKNATNINHTTASPISHTKQQCTAHPNDTKSDPTQSPQSTDTNTNEDTLKTTSSSSPNSSATDSNHTITNIQEEKKAPNDEGIVLSLDSSDEDAEEQHPKPKLSSFSQHKAYHTWKHRSKYGLNRSKSSTSSASMTALLRANHIRNHKYNGILKHKSKKKCYDQKSDSVVNTSPNRKHKGKGKGPTFNPEHVFLSKNNRTIINVGGSLYETTLNTLSADQSSMLSAMFSGRFKIERDENGSIFIDRDPTHFRHILNFLRDGIEYLKHGGLLQQPDAIVNELLQEAKYYNIRPLVDYIQLQQTRKNKKNGDELTHEKQYKLVTNIGVDEFEDVFNKYTGSAGYDFEEWLFVSPYKTSRNSVSSPSFIMLFSKKLSRAEVRLLDRLTNIDFQ